MSEVVVLSFKRLSASLHVKVERVVSVPEPIEGFKRLSASLHVKEGGGKETPLAMVVSNAFRHHCM